MTPLLEGISEWVFHSLHANSRSGFVLLWFACCLADVALGIGLAAVLRTLLPAPLPGSWLLPAAFSASTFLLAAGSLTLQLSLRNVQRERQRLFRQRLRWAVVAGTLFLAVQCYALGGLLAGQPRTPFNASTSAQAFAFVLASLHAMHFALALVCLLYVTLLAYQGRYDHEYYWGVLVCTIFWHTLGVAWCGILVVYVLSAASGFVPSP